MLLNPNQVIYHVEGFEHPVRNECPPCPTSSEGRTTSHSIVNESDKQSGSAEIAVSAAPLSAESNDLNGHREGASPELNVESPVVSQRESPAHAKEGSAACEEEAGHSTTNYNEPDEASRDALDEAIEKVTAIKDLVWKSVAFEFTIR